MNEGILPSFRSNDMEEERRLAYVAMTRAEKRLYITYHKSSVRVNFLQEPSRFIFESNLTTNNYNILNKYNKIENIVVPIGYEGNVEPTNGDLVFHVNFGEGVVLEVSDDTATIAFNKKHGVKELLKNHGSLYYKK
jgi:DNA helicase-2/ATP-dependent DNA helicase PcrA